MIVVEVARELNYMACGGALGYDTLLFDTDKSHRMRGPLSVKCA